VVGDLASLDEHTAVIRTRIGPVEVAVPTIAVAKLALPSTADELALEATAARGWRPEHIGCRGRLGAASRRRIHRSRQLGPAACALPQRPLDEALDEARAWYADHGLPLRIQVPTDARRLLDAELADRGWPADPDTHVLAARLDALPAAPIAGEHAVGIADVPAEAWYARYRNGAGAAEAARALLTRHDNAGFASISLDGRVVAIGRGAVDDGWLGVTAVDVVPELRRQGLASAVMRALWRWGAAAGAGAELPAGSDRQRRRRRPVRAPRLLAAPRLPVPTRPERLAG